MAGCFHAADVHKGHAEPMNQKKRTPILCRLGFHDWKTIEVESEDELRDRIRSKVRGYVRQSPVIGGRSRLLCNCWCQICDRYDYQLSEATERIRAEEQAAWDEVLRKQRDAYRYELRCRENNLRRLNKEIQNLDAFLGDRRESSVCRMLSAKVISGLQHRLTIKKTIRDRIAKRIAELQAELQIPKPPDLTAELLADNAFEDDWITRQISKELNTRSEVQQDMKFQA